MLTGKKRGEFWDYPKGVSNLEKLQIHKAGRNRYLSINLQLCRFNFIDKTARQGPVHHLQLVKQFHKMHTEYVRYYKKETLGVYDKIIARQLEYPLLNLTFDVVQNFSRKVLFSLWAMMHGEEKGHDTQKFVQMLEWVKSKLAHYLADENARTAFLQGDQTLHVMYKADGAGAGAGARAVAAAVTAAETGGQASGVLTRVPSVQTARAPRGSGRAPPTVERDLVELDEAPLEPDVDDKDFDAFITGNAGTPASVARQEGVEGDVAELEGEEVQEAVIITETVQEQIRTQLEVACLEGGLACLQKHGAARTLGDNKPILEPNPHQAEAYEAVPTDTRKDEATFSNLARDAGPNLKGDFYFLCAFQKIRMMNELYPEECSIEWFEKTYPDRSLQSMARELDDDRQRVAQVNLNKWGDFIVKHGPALEKVEQQLQRLEKLRDVVKVLVTAGKMTEKEGNSERYLTKTIMGAYLSGREFGDPRVTWRVGSKNKSEVDEAFLEYIADVGGVASAVAVAALEVAEAARLRAAAAAAAAARERAGDDVPAPAAPGAGRAEDTEVNPLSEIGVNASAGQGEPREGGDDQRQQEQAGKENESGEARPAKRARGEKVPDDPTLVAAVKAKMGVLAKPTIKAMTAYLREPLRACQKPLWADWAKAVVDQEGEGNNAPVNNDEEMPSAPRESTLLAEALRSMR